MRDHTITAIHEIGHALAAWYNGTPISLLAVGDGIHADDDLDTDVLGVNRVDGHMLLRTTFETGGHVWLRDPKAPDGPGGEALMRRLLEVLAGPAAQWLALGESEGDAKDATFDALLVDGGIGPGCVGDLEQAETILGLLPREQRPAAFTLSCWRAEALVGHYWPEILAMAEELLAQRRLEQHDIDLMMARHLGRPPWAGARQLADLDPPSARLGDAAVVPRWSRAEPWRWNLQLYVGGYALSMPRSLIYITDEEGAEEGLPADWYALVDHDHLTKAPSPAGGTLQAFAAQVMATKLEELRRSPAPITNA